MKLLAYTIAGQKIGIDIETWNDAMLSGNTAFMAIADTGSTPTDYVDISSIVYWDQFGAITTLTEVEIRQEITKLITLTPTPEEITILEEWGILIDTTIISGETGTFWGNFRVEGKLWVETIRRVKQEANIAYVRVDQDSGVSGGNNIAGLGILNPTGATTGYTNLEEIPVYYVGIDNDGVLVAGWSGNTQPVMLGSSAGVYGSEYQLASDLTESTTSSNTPVDKLTMTTTDLPAGTYKATIAWIGSGSAANSDNIFDVTLNGTPQGTNPTMNMEPKDASNFFPYVRIFYFTISGVNDIAIRYWSESVNTVNISDTTIELIRVS